MDFLSKEFLFFLILLISAYSVVKKEHRTLLLLGASYLFYGYLGIPYLMLLVIVTFLGYQAAFLIDHFAYRARLILISYVALNVGLPVWFKYADALLAIPVLWDIRVPKGLEIVLPLGLSFYMLQTLAYVFDVYRGKKEVERSYFTFSCFVAFFPQLVSGPIERSGKLIPQIKRFESLRYNNCISGSYLVMLGVLKKLVVANNLEIYREFVLANHASLHTADVIFFPLATLFWVYFDFSSYTDIARGVARIFGVSLTENFNLPLAAKSFRGFWGRWHISLNKWLSDYVYVPLARRKRDYAWRSFCIMIVFLLMGLWHSYNFIFFFLLNGIFLVLEIYLLQLKKRSTVRMVKSICGIYSSNGFVITLICLTSVFYGVESLSQSLALIDKFLERSWTMVMPFGMSKFLLLGLGFAVLFEIASRTKKGNDQLIRYVIEHDHWRWAYPVVLFYLVGLFGEFENVDYFYYGF